LVSFPFPLIVAVAFVLTLVRPPLYMTFALLLLFVVVALRFRLVYPHSLIGCWPSLSTPLSVPNRGPGSKSVFDSDKRHPPIFTTQHHADQTTPEPIDR
jgi:hypothetical protein